MLLQRSKLAAGTAERPRLASPWSIALLGTMLLTVLAAIYPHQTLVRRVIEAPTNELTEAYLTNLLRTDAENPELRLVLARNQLQAGLMVAVGIFVVPLFGSEALEMPTALPQVATGVEAAEQAADTLRQIKDGAQSTLDRVREVAESTKEQSVASDSIAQKVEEIATMVEETTAAMHATAQTAEDLERISGELNSLVSRFRC